MMIKARSWAFKSILMFVALLGAFLGTTTAANVCTQTAADVLKSCRSEVQSDFLLAIAKCDNAGNSSACRQEAAAVRADDLESCSEQADSRMEACRDLGPSAYNPEIDPSNFTDQIDNPYFPLVPGTTFVYEGETPDGLEHSEFFVTHRRRVIMGVSCVEVRDRVWLDGQPAEDTLDWFAQDTDGNVWYFGENTHELENGLITTIDGSFQAGVNNAKPGIIMEARPKAGDFYRQEFDLANAEDFAEVTGLNASVSVPFGNFTRCLKTTETTPLEPELREDKFYARGVGNVLTIDRTTGSRIELIRVKHQ